MSVHLNRYHIQGRSVAQPFCYLNDKNTVSVALSLTAGLLDWGFGESNAQNQNLNISVISPINS